MGINMIREKQTWNITDVIDYSSITDPQYFSAALQQIDTKLNDIKKEITYWDVYNISSAITSAEQFESKIANLEINNSTVINTTYFKRNFQGEETTFYSGDIIIRLKDGSYQHIRSANAGIYVPDLQSFTQEELRTYYDNYEINKTEEIITHNKENNKYIWHSDKGYPKDGDGNDICSNNLILTYNYETTAPLNDDDSGYKKFSTRIQSLSGDKSKMYGYSIPGTYNGEVETDEDGLSVRKVFDFPIVDGEYNQEKVPIIPVLKFFDSNNQEVYTDEYVLWKGNPSLGLINPDQTIDKDTNPAQDASKYYFYLRNNSSGLIQKVVIK